MIQAPTAPVDARPNEDVLVRIQLATRYKTGADRLEQLEEKRESVVGKSREFVGIFYGMMMQQMRATLPGNPLFDGGRGEEIFQQRIDNMLGEQMAGHHSRTMTRDGHVRVRSNPLAEDFAKSLSRTLDRQIDGVRRDLDGIRRAILSLGPLPGAEYDKLDELNSRKLRQADELRIEAAGRVPVAPASEKLK